MKKFLFSAIALLGMTVASYGANTVGEVEKIEFKQTLRSEITEPLNNIIQFKNFCLEKTKPCKMTVKGTVNGKEVNIDVTIDVEKGKSCASAYLEIAKELLD